MNMSAEFLYFWLYFFFFHFEPIDINGSQFALWFRSNLSCLFFSPLLSLNEFKTESVLAAINSFCFPLFSQSASSRLWYSDKEEILLTLIFPLVLPPPHPVGTPSSLSTFSNWSSFQGSHDDLKRQPFLYTWSRATLWLTLYEYLSCLYVGAYMETL